MQVFVGAPPDEEWDYVDDDDLLLSFDSYGASLGPPPSAEEAAEATLLLRQTLHGSHAPAEPSSFRLIEPGSPDEQSETGEGDSVSASVPELVAAARNRAAHNRQAFVRHALQVFNQDENLQRAVSSLACDPALWRAVNNNPDVKELLRGHQRPLPASNGPPAPPPKEAADSAFSVRRLVHAIMDRFSSLKASIWGAFVCMFGGGPGAGSADEGEQNEEIKFVIPALVVLVVLVIGIIVLKRPIYL